MQRVAVVVCSALLALAGLLGIQPAASGAAPPVVLDSLTVPATAPGQSVSATTRVHSTSGNVAAQAITVAVRDAAGNAYDFPGATAATITPSGYTFTSGARTFAAGTYQVFTAIQVGGQWTNLTPTQTFTVAPPSVVLDSLALPVCAVAGQTVGASTRVHASSGNVVVQAITVAVRGPDGTAYDFPGATAATIPSSGYTFTSGSRTFAAGTYQAFTAVQVGGRWTSLTPAGSFTVGAAADPVTFCQQFNGAAGGDANSVVAGDVRPTARTWTTDPCWYKKPTDKDDACTGTLAEYNDDHARLDGAGSLVLTADRVHSDNAFCKPVLCSYGTARLTMLDWAANGGRPTWSQTGGHIEARIKSPAGRGLWPAFWTVGANQATVPWPQSGEIDIMEQLGQFPLTTGQHAHGYDPTTKTEAKWDFDSGLASPGITGWHVYAIDWNATATGYIKWSVDGVVVQQLSAATANGRSAWASFQGAQSLILDLAVGGGDGGVPGPPDASTAFPARMYVDYVRVLRYPTA